MAILACLVFITEQIVAQRMQSSETFVTPTNIPLSGKKNYSYIVGEDGKNLKDGSYSASANVTNQKIQIDYVRSATLNANYKLNANFKKGFLHGPLNLSIRIAASRLGKTETETAVMTGNMQDGYPHGIFTVNNNLDGYSTKLNANYNKGILIGRFSCETLYDDRTYEVRGTLTPKGELNGQWVYNTNIYSRTFVFQNGIMISESDKEKSTPPALVALAKKYANKMIAEDELLKQNIVILRDSLLIGALAENAILKDNTVELRDLGEYDFSQRPSVKYEYLRELPFLTDEGVSMVIEELINHTLLGRTPETLNRCGGDVYEDYIRMNKDINIAYVSIYKSKMGNYAKGGVVEIENDVYITTEQLEMINNALQEAIKKNTVDALSLVKKIPYVTPEERGLDFEMMVEDNASELPYIDIKNWFVHNETLNDINDPNLLKEGLDEVIRVKEDLLKDIYTKPYEKDSSILIYSRPEISRKYFINKSSLANLSVLDNKISERMMNLFSDYVVSNKDSYNIVSNAKEIFFDKSGLDYYSSWRDELRSRIIDLCPIVACKVVEMNENGDVLLDITKRISKKKGNVTYRVPLKIKKGAIIIKSIDFNKVTKIE